ncbi:hypothetical protein PR202_gb10507 [Eleusine coracana subsp. coracana]|uniref:DNA gyrase subunit A n=1 Tax=Eleusine coracana subsp. coracana TaxID=191504 RepID=A0AAV5EKW3_ELECO|nr:hypothetical protein PR202_gb10507 [Eleusine coracana subsp. coracana]
MNPNTFNLQHRGTIGKSVGKMRMNDSMSDFIVCQAHDHVLYFSDKGIVYSARAYKIPECTRNAAGTPLIQLLSLSDGERITSIIPVSEFGEDQYLVMLTANGYIKKVPLNAFSTIRSTGIISIQLVPDDELRWVRRCGDDDLVALASQKGMVIVNSCNKVASYPWKENKRCGCNEAKGSTNQFTNVSSRVRDLSPPWLLFIAENGVGKRVPLNAFRQSSFNRVGLQGAKVQDGCALSIVLDIYIFLRCIQISVVSLEVGMLRFNFSRWCKSNHYSVSIKLQLPPDCRLAAVFVAGLSLSDDGESDEQVVLVSQSGTVNRIKVNDISIQSRAAKGVILMRLEHAGKIQSASLISAAAEAEAEAEQVTED